MAAASLSGNTNPVSTDLGWVASEGEGGEDKMGPGVLC